MKEHCKHMNEEKVREETLIDIEYDVFVSPLSEDQEEAHYVHTINAFVELIVLYGWDKVTSDLRAAMGAKQW